MLTADELHSRARRYASAGNRAAKQGQMAKARGWWRYGARMAEKTNSWLAADLWRRAGNHARALGIIRDALSTARAYEHRELVNLMRRCEIERREGQGRWKSRGRFSTLWEPLNTAATNHRSTSRSCSGLSLCPNMAPRKTATPNPSLTPGWPTRKRLRARRNPVDPTGPNW